MTLGDNRISKARGKFWTYKKELCGPHYRLGARLRLFDAVVTSTVLYACGCWTMTVAREAQLRGAQRKMLRKVAGMGRRKKQQPSQQERPSHPKEQYKGLFKGLYGFKVSVGKGKANSQVKSKVSDV